MSSHKVTILIPNYQTPQLTKVCLRLIRKHTDFNIAKILVIDNDSADESLSYLQSLNYIKLLQRHRGLNESGASSHSSALDLGLQKIDTPYVLSIHTDTWVHHPHYLSFLVNQIEKDDRIAGVGSWKLANKYSFKRIEHLLEYYGLVYGYQTINKLKAMLSGKPNYYYLRSHCALYRTAFLRKHGLTFSDSSASGVGNAIHQKLLQHGYRMIFLSPETLLRYIEHIDHATTTLNPTIRTRKSYHKDKQQLQKTWQRFQADAILADTSLDQ